MHEPIKILVNDELQQAKSMMKQAVAEWRTNPRTAQGKTRNYSPKVRKTDTFRRTHDE